MTTVPSQLKSPVGAAPAYRWDINLYRAMAVIIVLLFHLDVPGFTQGFLGVDLFFLISGYVITQSLERKRGTKFSASGFFLGRVYRILPMVSVTVALTLVLSGVFLAPTDLVKAAQSGLATLFSVANIYFYATIDYFDPASAAKPLLHMWSLGVEEQFYIFFPLVFLLLASLGGRRVVIWAAFALTTIATISAAALSLVPDNALFYLLPFRMNQFLAGSAAFYIVNLAAHRVGMAKMIWCALAAVGLAAAVLLDLPFVYRLTAILTFIMMPLFVLDWSQVANAKAFTPLHRIADWSYSIYVLHWPIIAFWVLSQGELDLTGQIVCGALTITLSWLTYRFVERTFQKRRHDKGRWGDAFKTVLAPLLLLAAICVGIIASKGLAFRVDADLTETLRQFEDDKDVYFDETITRIASMSEFSEDRISVAILGDSFAGDMNRIVRELPGVETMIAAKTTAFCRSLTIPKKPEDKERCEANAAFLEQDFSTADIVLIAEIVASFGQFEEVDRRGYEAAIAQIRASGFDGPIVVSGIRPIYREAPYQLAFSVDSLTALQDAATERLVLTPTAMSTVSLQMADWAEAADVTLMPLFPVMCDESDCMVTDENAHLLYIDKTHFSASATPLLLDYIGSVLLNGASPKVTVQSESGRKNYAQMSDAELATLPNKSDAISLSMLQNDMLTAERITDFYLAETENPVDLILTRWRTLSDLSSRRVTVLLAERFLDNDHNGAIRYIAGQAYFGGRIRPYDEAKIIALWDDPRMSRNGTVQYRLSTIYGNPNSDFYNAEKAAAALEASEAAGFEPKD